MRSVSASRDPSERMPITGIAACCARAASGQATADPAIPAMKSRRRIAFPRLGTTHSTQAIKTGICDQRYGVKFCLRGSILEPPMTGVGQTLPVRPDHLATNVRFPSDTDRKISALDLLRCAITGREQS